MRNNSRSQRSQFFAVFLSKYLSVYVNDASIFSSRDATGLRVKFYTTQNTRLFTLRHTSWKAMGFPKYIIEWRKTTEKYRNWINKKIYMGRDVPSIADPK